MSHPFYNETCTRKRKRKERKARNQMTRKQAKKLYAMLGSTDWNQFKFQLLGWGNITYYQFANDSF